MCDGYTLAKPPTPREEWAAALPLALDWSGEKLIRPGFTAPVLLPDGSAPVLKWGFQRPFFPSMHLAKATALEGQPWKLAFERGRCVVPVTSFFEVEDKRGRGRTYEFSAPDGDWIWVAGLWDVETKKPRRFALIMVETPVVGHVTQRPALLSGAEARAYLAGELDSIPMGHVDMKCVEVPGALRLE